MLSPLFALAALAIAGPILLHLVRRRPKETLPFSSLMFLEDSPPKWTQQSRIEQWLLLALRVSVIALLALAFTRPYWASAAKLTGGSELGIRRIVLLDQSASMRRAGIWDAANARVSELLANSNPADVVAVYSFDQKLHPLLSLATASETSIANRKRTVLEAIRKAAPGWGEGNLGGAISECAELLQRERSEVDGGANGAGEIVVISDFVIGTPIEELSGREWPETISLRLERVLPSHMGNAHFESRADENASNPSGWRVRVTNEPGSKHERFQLHWIGERGNRIEPIALDCTVPAGQVMTYQVPLPSTQIRGLELSGDECEFDNRRFVVPSQGRSVRVLCLENTKGGPETSLLHFLERVPFGNSEDSIEIVRVNTGDDWSVTAQPSDTWIVCATDFSEKDCERLIDFMNVGGHVLWVLDEPIVDRRPSPTEAAIPVAADAGFSNRVVLSEIARRFEKLTGSTLKSLSEAKIEQYGLLGRIDFKHPVFAPLVDPKFNDFSKVRFWRHRKIELASLEGWVIPAWFDSGAPAILQRRFGHGELTILAAGWQPVESQFALSSKFVPIISQLFSSATVREAVSIDWIAGKSYTLPESAVVEPLLEASPLDSVESNDPRSRSSTGLSGGRLEWIVSPGVWKLGDSDGSRRDVAANIASAESHTELMDFEELSRYGATVREKPQSREDELQKERLLVAAELESRQSLWWWLLLFVLVIAGGESLLCIRKQGRTEGAVSA